MYVWVGVNFSSAMFLNLSAVLATLNHTVFVAIGMFFLKVFYNVDNIYFVYYSRCFEFVCLGCVVDGFSRSFRPIFTKVIAPPTAPVAGTATIFSFR